jgi:2-polyprenyl-3-methyl-5-hydroxy-6-metoxy-1,4-benzoquinol methylase
MVQFSDEKIIESWKANAHPWIATVRDDAIESRRLVTNQAIINAVRSRNPTSGLDIGCGEGCLVRALHGIRMSGIDVVPDLIAKAQQEGQDDFRMMSYEDLANGLLKSRFDVGICNFSLLGKESVDDVFRSSREILNPGGALIVQTLHPVMSCGEEPYVDGWRAGSWKGFSEQFSDPPPWYFRTIESWVTLYRSAGLELLEVREPLHPASGKPASIIFIGELMDI